MERLAYLTQQIQSIGSNEIAAELDTSSEDADDEKKVKELEEYPLPLAVVGVSVL